MRVRLNHADRKKLFYLLEINGYTITAFALRLGINRRTVFDWKRGKFNIPHYAYEEMLSLTGLNMQSFKAVLVDESKQKSRAGRIGGKIQWRKNGTIGTHEDRIKGGRASFVKRRNRKKDIFVRKKIVKPTRTTKLAEFIGICMGDGCITDYQLSVSINDEHDKEYLEFVSEFSELIFGLRPKIQKIKHSRCSNVVLSSVALTEFLVNQGLPKGDKLRAGLDIPEWIKCNDRLSKACLRGLFDTDGSIFLETHHTNGRQYSYPRLSFVSASKNLRHSICDILYQLGFKPKIRMNRSVNLEKFTDIEEYFRIIGSSNPKHLYRFVRFGGVA